MASAGKLASAYEEEQVRRRFFKVLCCVALGFCGAMVCKEEWLLVASTAFTAVTAAVGWAACRRTEKRLEREFNEALAQQREQGP